MTQAVRHIIIMVWGTGLALGYFACIARALRVRAERVLLNRQRSHPQRLGCAWPLLSPEAARMRFTPSKVNDGKILVFVDLSEINYKPLPTRSPAGHHPVTVSPQSAGRRAASGAGQT